MRTFAALLAGTGAAVFARHVVDESLLADARRVGLADGALRDRIAARLRAAADGASAVLCTCSTIGGVAESLGPAVGVSVVRIDRPMAAAAVRIARRTGGVIGGVIGVVATVASTVGPTEELLRAVTAESGVDVEIRMLPCLAAWPLFERGDRDGYLDMIAAQLRAHDAEVDVFVLAQASMMDATKHCAGLRTPVLASPPLAVAELIRRAGASDRASRPPRGSPRSTR